MKYNCSYESFKEYAERFRKKFPQNDTYIIFGTGQKFQKVKKQISDILFVVDNDQQKWGMELDGLRVKSPDILKEYKETKIIVAVQGYMDVDRQLENYGLREENYCHYNEFLMIEDYFGRGKISVPEVTFMVNNRCTLSCKGCIEYIPYVEKQQNFSLQQIKDSIDDFFMYADYCEDISLVGGEALLYGKLDILLEYLYGEYVKTGHAKRIKITTNGTIMPNNHMLQTLKRYNVVVVISDYKAAIGERSLADKIIMVFLQWRIEYLIENRFSRAEEGKWFDMGNPLQCKNMAETALKNHFNKCTVMCSAVWDSKLFNCNGVRSNIMNLGCKTIDSDNDYCDLKSDQKEKFVMYYLGYNNKGYYNFCNYCNGYGEYLNKSSIMPGEQNC